MPHNIKPSPSLAPSQASFREIFTPKIITILKEGYDLQKLKADSIASLTVAIVALPLSMAIAIACGAKPEAGLYTAIFGGLIISVLGGSRYQIGGPSGSFIVIIAITIERHGYDGFLLATFLAGVLLLAIGFMRLGVYIKYIPHPVRVGFTAGIGVILLASQVSELLGLTLSVKEPAEILPKLGVLYEALPTINPWTAFITVLTISIIVGIKHIKPNWPNLLIAVVTASVVANVFELPVATIGTRFGGIPSSLPHPVLPTFTLAKIQAVLPIAAAFTLLSGIESLLSAVVADAMTGRRHRSNCELVAQGIANMVCALLGGLPATGTVARTATNVRAGAIGPISGVIHAIILLLFMVFASNIASAIPLAALSGILAVVSINMIDNKEFRSAFQRSRGEGTVLLITFLLTVFRDLTEGIAVGVVLGSLLFMHRMASLVTIEQGLSLTENDDIADAPRTKTTAAEVHGDLETLIYRINGPLFFGVSTTVSTALARIGRLPQTIILDFSSVPFADSTAVESLQAFVDRVINKGGTVYVAGASFQVRRILIQSGLHVLAKNYHKDVETAQEYAKQVIEKAAE